MCFAASLVYDLSERTILLHNVDKVGFAVRWDWSWDLHWLTIAIAFSSVTTSRSPPGVRVMGDGVGDAMVMIIACLVLCQQSFSLFLGEM